MHYLWDDLLSEQDKAVIQQAGYDSRGASAFDSRQVGQHPALLVIDMQRLIVGANLPILDAVAQESMAMGEIAWRALDTIVPFTNACRRAKLPIMYTRIIPHNRNPDDDQLAIVEPLAPRPDDLVIDKHFPSPFYGTDLLTYLVKRRIDTLIVVGNSTSGCVRATAVDGRQMGYGVLVPYDCVFDRIEASHKIGLLDMWMKYASVMSSEAALDYVNSVT